MLPVLSVAGLLAADICEFQFYCVSKYYSDYNCSVLCVGDLSKVCLMFIYFCEVIRNVWCTSNVQVFVIKFNSSKRSKVVGKSR